MDDNHAIRFLSLCVKLSSASSPLRHKDGDGPVGASQLPLGHRQRGEKLSTVSYDFDLIKRV